ncbi:hypothetical protein ALC152_05110 [Arcobacter sp. 15-2]|uniref:hypothetical protein n=1 Tax=Arcobacter sp. 15-2 TaxID=3374109 RepID=UPI00399CC6AA
MLNNTVKFPNLLGKIDLETSRVMENVLEEKYSFNGNNIVLERKNNISTNDMILLLQLIESSQKMNSELVMNDNYKTTYTDDERSSYISSVKKYCLEGEGREIYQSFKDDKEGRLAYISKLVQERLDKDNLEKYKMYFESDENYKLKVDIGMLLKARNLVNKVENRAVIVNSLENLFGTVIKFYFLNEDLSNDFKKIKQNKTYSEWKDEVKSHFIKNKRKSKMFLRHLIEKMNVSEDYKVVEIELNRGFVDYCSTSRFYNYEHLINLKGNSAKALFFYISFNYKEFMTKDLMFDVMDLNYARADRNLAKAKESINELIEKGILTKSSGYDRKNKRFVIKLTASESKKLGYVNRIKYSKGGKK